MGAVGQGGVGGGHGGGARTGVLAVQAARGRGGHGLVAHEVGGLERHAGDAGGVVAVIGLARSGDAVQMDVFGVDLGRCVGNGILQAVVGAIGTA